MIRCSLFFILSTVFLLSACSPPVKEVDNPIEVPVFVAKPKVQRPYYESKKFPVRFRLATGLVKNEAVGLEVEETANRLLVFKRSNNRNSDEVTTYIEYVESDTIAGVRIASSSELLRVLQSEYPALTWNEQGRYQNVSGYYAIEGEDLIDLTYYLYRNDRVVKVHLGKINDRSERSSFLVDQYKSFQFIE